jgi:hypothetical protein
MAFILDGTVPDFSETLYFNEKTKKLESIEIF